MAAQPTYYNEFNKDAAAWLRNLINAGHIAHGIVDERSIEDVFPSDLRGFKQCHFFAGIGVWSYALRSAGWSDDRPIWTGSCPCQPFSAAGQGVGFDDKRHLWPHFHHLIKQCNPAAVLGEQVASKDADPWIDLVQDDLEALGYAFGAVPFPSAGIGAPHIRDRLYWVGHAAGTGPQGGQPAGQRSDAQCASAERAGAAGGLEHPKGGGQPGQPLRAGALGPAFGDAQRGDFGGLADVQGSRRGEKRAHLGGQFVGDLAQGWPAGSEHGGSNLRPGPTNGFWRDADWLGCRDGKWRPVEPGTFPLVNGAPARVGRLRGYGNAINAQAARVFIEAVMESL